MQIDSSASEQTPYVYFIYIRSSSSKYWYDKNTPVFAWNPVYTM